MSTVIIPGASVSVGVGYLFTGSYLGWVGPLVSVKSSGGSGIVDTLFSGATLDNDGYISSTSSYGNGVFFGVFASEGHIRNEIDGKIDGSSFGVDVDSASCTVDNYGYIKGTHGVSFDNYSFVGVLNNHGVIYGGVDGVLLESQKDYDHILLDNWGAVAGDFGIVVVTAEHSTTSITNNVTGVIGGENGSGIIIDSGKVFLTNSGNINNGIYDSGEANNVFVNPGHIHGTLWLGDGNDLYNGAGGTVDQILCGVGNDEIILGAGNTIVHVNQGRATLTAGSGHDVFYFDTLPVGHVDHIAQFGVHLDRIGLSKAAFPGIARVPLDRQLAAADFGVGAHATTSSEHIVYNPSNGFLYYDHDGSGPAHQVHFATLTAHLALTSHYFLVGA